MEKGWESMNTAQRRTEILKLLQQAEKPVAARAMASQFGVSRQVIVQDMAVIRASTPVSYTHLEYVISVRRSKSERI